MQHETSFSGGATSSKSQRQVLLLEEEIRSLKDELSSKYKREAVSATSQLELSSEMRTLHKEMHRLKEEYTTAVSELSKCRENIVLLEETVNKKQNTNQQLETEVVELRGMFNRSEERGLKLQNENILITQRVMEEKTKLMEEMNRMTEINAKLQEKLVGFNQPSTATERIEATGWFPSKTQQPAPSEPLHAFQAHSTEISAVKFNEDGKEFVTGCSDGTVKVWNTRTIECLHVLRSSNETAILTVHMHGSLVLGGGR